MTGKVHRIHILIDCRFEFTDEELDGVPLEQAARENLPPVIDDWMADFWMKGLPEDEALAIVVVPRDTDDYELLEHYVDTFKGMRQDIRDEAKKLLAEANDNK